MPEHVRTAVREPPDDQETQIAEHDIETTIPTKPLINVDATILIRSDGAKLGELHISKGTADWRSKNKNTLKAISWERFPKLMDEA